MAANTEHLFNALAQSRITAGITASATSLTLIPGGVIDFLPGWISGKEFYCTLVDASANREIIKVTDIVDHTFTIERGQDSSSARAWPVGTVIAQRCVAANFTRFMQKLDFRTITYNPNGVLTAAYPGEKVYYPGYGNCQSWWKHTSGTTWKLIAGTPVEVGNYFDNTYWSTSGLNNEWDGTKWQLYVVQNGSQQRSLAVSGTWYQDFRPGYIAVDYTGVALDGLMLWDSDQNVIAGAVDSGYESGTELAITFGSLNIGWLTFVMPPEYLYCTDINFTSCSV